MRTSTLFSLASLIPVAQGFSPIANNNKVSSSKTSLSAINNINDQQSRSSFLQTLSGSAAAIVFSPLVANADDATVVNLPSGTTYEVIKTGDGPKPTIGELGAIRFRAEVKQTGNKIDDIFDTPEPYYTRVGSGGLLKVSSTKSVFFFSLQTK